MSMHVLVDGANGQMANLQISGRPIYVRVFVCTFFVQPASSHDGWQKKKTRQY